MADVVQLRRFRFRHEAELARMHLEGAGIPATVWGESFPEHVAWTPIQLLVRSADAVEASRILTELEAAHPISEAELEAEALAAGEDQERPKER